MKKLGIFLFVAIIAAALAVSVSARDVSFKPYSEGERTYMVELTKGAGNDGGNRFLDASNYLVYRFPVSKHDIVASFTATIGAQYKIEASSNGKDYTVVDQAVMPEGAAENWGADRVSRTYNLAAYLTGNDGYIYVRISDANPANGWGPYIVTADGIKFSSSVQPGQSYTFKPFTDAEAAYTVELTSGAGNDGGNHFLDGTNYIIYRFPVSSKDTYALFSAKIGAQYQISASNDNKNYKVLDAAVKPEGAEASWGADRAMRYIDVSEFITAYDGYIYIKIEDVDKSNGWGPYIVTDAGVSFTTTVPDLQIKSLYHNADGAYTGAGPVALQLSFDPTDLSAYFVDGMAVGIRVYVKGSANFVNNGQLEFTSSGTCDQQEFHWASTVNFKIHDGWNILVYPISKGTNESKAVLSAINFIRLFQFSDAEYTFNVTDIFVGPQTKIEAQNASPLLYIVKDSTEGFTGAGPVVIQKNFATPLNLSGYLGNGMAIGIIADMDGVSGLVDNGQFELTSSGTCDAEEVTLGSVYSKGVKNGANLIVYDLSGVDTSAANTAAINFIRIYQFSDSDYTMNISNIVIGPLSQIVALVP